ncbi:MAG: transposase [Bacteroidia bacterium]|nr:transposase [Bacteroidia bacterium]MBP7773197.1 transposase [Bacteroidia bacterium]
MSKPQIKFVKELFNVLFTIQGRVNFTNLARYSQFGERTFRRWFHRAFDFIGLHTLLMSRLPEGEMIAAIDCVNHTKAGSKTYGIGRFWSTISHCNIKGIELSTIALIHLDLNQGFAVSAKQTDGSRKAPSSRMKQYIRHLIGEVRVITRYTRYIAADGFYAKSAFIQAVLASKLHLVSKLRQDANLRYLYSGKKENPKDRRRKFDGKFQINNLSKLNFVGKEQGYRIYQQIVYSIRFKRNIQIVLVTDGRDKYDLIFTTDLELAPQKVVAYYRSRFQIELLFRDAKQHLGFTHCQSRKKESLDFHYNASLLAINLAKIDILTSGGFKANTCISIDDYKRKSFNRHFLNLVIENLAPKFDLKILPQNIKNLINYGSMAA